MQCDRLMLMVGVSFCTLSRGLPTDQSRFMIIPSLGVTVFVILVVWFLLPRVVRLMIHTPTAISIFVCLSIVQLMAVFISMRCCFFFQAEDGIRDYKVTGVQTCALPISARPLQLHPAPYASPRCGAARLAAQHRRPGCAGAAGRPCLLRLHRRLPVIVHPAGGLDRKSVV